MEEHGSHKMDDVMQFVVFAIECAAAKAGIPSPELYNRLQRLDIVDQVLIDAYDMLHTQGRPFIADYVLETLANWEKSEKEKGGAS